MRERMRMQQCSFYTVDIQLNVNRWHWSPYCCLRDPACWANVATLGCLIFLIWSLIHFHSIQTHEINAHIHYFLKDWIAADDRSWLIVSQQTNTLMTSNDKAAQNDNFSSKYYFSSHLLLRGAALEWTSLSTFRRDSSLTPEQDGSQKGAQNRLKNPEGLRYIMGCLFTSVVS